MAIKKIIEVEINDNINVTTDHIDELNKDIKQTEKNVESLNKEFEQTAKQTAEAFKPLKAQYKEALLEVQRMTTQFGETSKEVQQAARRAAELKDRIEDANDAVQAFKGEGLFLATGKAVSSVASGFSAVEGAMGLLGVESEKVQETLLRVNSAMALASGLAGLEDVGRSFALLGTRIGAVATTIKTQLVTAFTTLKGAIIATGIGALVVAIGFLIPKIMEWMNSTSELEKEQNRLNRQIEKSNALYEENTKELDKNIEAELRLAKARGASDQELLNIEKKGQTERNKNAKERAKQLDAEIKEKRNQYLRAYVDEDWDRAKALQKEQKDLMNQRKQIAQDIKDQNDELKLQQQELNLTQERKRRENLHSVQKDVKKEKDITVDTKKQELEELERLKNEARLKDIDNKNALSLEIENIDNQNFEKTLTKQQQEERAVNEKYFNLIENAKNYGLETATLEEAQQSELLDIKNRFRDEDLKAQKEKDQQELDNAKKLKEDKERLELAKIDAVRNGFSIIGNLAKAFAGQSEEEQKKAFEVQKAANIANAIVDTYASATAAYKSLAGIPGVGSVLGGIAAGAAIAAGLANVRAIEQTTFQSTNVSNTNTGGGTTPNATEPQAPRFNIIGGTQQNANVEQKPIQAYVVSGEVTSQQALDRNRLRNATL